MARLRNFPVAAALGALLASPGVADANGRALLSFVDLPVASGQSVGHFHIDTWFVAILAVCKVPSGWSITGANQGGPGGELEGQGVVGAAFARGRNPEEFKNLFLVDVHPPTRKSPEAPPTFDGAVDVSDDASNDQPKPVTLLGRSYRLTPATHCPQF